jgi:osmotically-inducible protein OsmY
MRRTSIVTAASLTLFMTLTASAAERRRPARTPAPQPHNLTTQFSGAGLNVDNLQVFELGGVVLVRGRAYSKADAEQAGRHAQSLGYDRVANLIQIVEPPDDDAIERTAEYELTTRQTLEGCRFVVESNQGYVKVAGTVQLELQKDMALQLLRNIEGVRAVNAEQLVRNN